jgi:hypothetical protein
MSKRVIKKISKKPKKTASPKRVIDKKHIYEDAICIDPKCPDHAAKDDPRAPIAAWFPKDSPQASTQASSNRAPELTGPHANDTSHAHGGGDPSEHDIIPTKTDLTVMFICGMLSMASMGLVLWFVVKLLS